VQGAIGVARSGTGTFGLGALHDGGEAALAYAEDFLW
jgi:hypothetical protein